MDRTRVRTSVRTSVRAGGLAAAGLAVLYAAVVGGVGGAEHLVQQAGSDWPWLVVILTGFGVQVCLFVELRRRRRMSRAVGATSGTGGSASAVGMVACCAHHLADLAPLIGLSGAAVFLTSYRTPIMAAAVAVNALGVLIAARRLRRTVPPLLEREATQCHVSS
jgi:hypothetical protein